MSRALVLSMLLLGPAMSLACSAEDRPICERLTRLLAERTKAMSTAFGDLSAIMPVHLDVDLTPPAPHPTPEGLAPQPDYDPQQRTLFLPHRFANESSPIAELARKYWPFYNDPQLRDRFPIVPQLDAALWSVYLQEAARRDGLSWPHPDCVSPDSARRLPCEMVMSAITEYVKTPLTRQRVFNVNRLEQIWPEDYEQFAGRLSRNDDRDVTDVRRYGGLLLLQPLVRKFGVSWTLAYIAKTPFRVEDNNMRLSAQRFQERALHSM